MLVTVRLQVRPPGVEADMERLTVPVKPFRAATVIVDAPILPA